MSTKNHILFVLSFFLWGQAFTQSQLSLEGKWNIVSIDSKEFFYDFTKDSFALKMPELFGTDIKKQNEFQSGIKMSFGSLYYRFNDKRQYMLCMPGLVRDSGDYIIKISTGEIEFQSREPGVESDIYQYKLNKELLRLKMPMGDTHMEMLFKREGEN
jgi:hypothetical protein